MKASTRALLADQEISEAEVSTASATGPAETASVTGPVRTARDAQPTEFPLDLDEWASRLRGTPWRTLLAGFRHHVRMNGGLRQKRLRGEWQEAFDKYAHSPTQR